VNPPDDNQLPMNRGLERPPAKLAGSIQVTGVKETGPPKARGSGAAPRAQAQPAEIAWLGFGVNLVA
jgi:hypothetical protein